MDFSSDTAAPAHPAVLEAMLRANSGTAPSYGADQQMAKLKDLLASALEIEDFDVWICASGTASNALALSLLCPPTGAILCHHGAHIAVDERGAPEFFTGGGKLQLLGGEQGKIDRDAFKAALLQINHEFVHETPAHVVSLTNLTESGTAYRANEIADYADLAHAAGLTLHLDGARLANALVSTGTSLAEMTWRAGVDVLTLGLTKTGAIGCEMLILFGAQRETFRDLQARAKRSGHMPPKMRYLAAQACALLQDGLWLSLAEAANQKAQVLARKLETLTGVGLAFPVEGNEVFATLPEAIVARLYEVGVQFYPWPDGSHRFVCHWATPDEDISTLARIGQGG